MSEYKIGKDVKALESRVAELESALKDVATGISNADLCPSSTIEVEAATFSEGEKMLDGVLVRSKSYGWNRAKVGKCTWDEYSVTFFENGRVVYNGTVDCNEPALFTCTFTHTIEARLSDGGQIQAMVWTSEHGGVTRNANESRNEINLAIRDSFDKISGGYARYNCRCPNC